jgi:hypothetical protein
VRGWKSIAYHYLIGPDGKVYQGAPAGKRTIHAQAGNASTIGVCLIGNFTKETLEAPQRDALLRTMAHAYRTHGISPEAPVYPHKHFKKKDCPGRSVEGRMEEFRRAAQALLR